MAHRAPQLGVLLLLMASSGCITVSAPTWSFPKPTLRRAKEAPKNERTSVPNQEDEEEKRPPLIAENTAGPPQTESAGLMHDPATRMLIDEELRDASPAQRSEWKEFLASVETSEVPELLKERRMAIRREPSQIASNLPENNSTDSKAEATEVLPVAHSISASAGNAGEALAEVTTADGAEDSEEHSVRSGSTTPPGSPAVNPRQKKFRSLTDPNWLWSHPPAEQGEEHPNTAGKTERGPFGLPQVRSNRNEREAVATLQDASPVSTLPVEAMPRTASIEPRITPGSALWEDEVVKLVSLLEAEVSASSPQDANSQRLEVRKQVALRMLYLVANDPQKAMQVIPGLPPEEQEFWTALFLGLSQHLEQSAASDPAERASQTIAQLRTAAYHLQQSANLRIRNAVFCQQINGFGNYDLFEADQFQPGQTVLLYAEIRNFRSAAGQDGFYTTRIRSTIEIYNLSNGQQLVDRSTFDPTVDRSRTLRTDYYHSYRLDLPANLATGPHMVKLILQDELSGKQSTESINFLVK